MSPPLRAAVVSYLNSVPLYWGLLRGPDREQFDVRFELPPRCADALRSGEVDAAIIPSIEYQRIPDLEIVPGLAVASAGPVRSVLLIAKCPVEKIQGLALTSSSRTSVCLIQILLRRHYRIAPRLVLREPNLNAMLAECDAALLIGDPALATDFPGLLVVDLAEAWRAMTGLPFVFAIWTVRPASARPGLAATLQRATVYALAHLSGIVEEETKRTGLSPQLIRSYLTENIDFSLGEKNLAGLRLFYELALEQGLTTQNTPLRFLE